MSKATGIEPVSLHERIDLIDALRGFALFGVVIANTVGQSGFNPYRNPDLINSQIDKTTFDVLLNFLIGAKFWSIFAFLFGLGFSLHLLRAQRKNQPFVSIYLRRIGALFLIGLCNYIFVAPGDILRDYAVIAILLLLLRNVSDRFLWIAVIISLLFPYLFRAIIDLIELKPSGRANPQVVQQAMQDGDYLKTIEFRLSGLKNYWRHILLNTGSTTCALFILGYYIARNAYFESISKFLPQVRKIFWIVLAAVVIGSLFSPYVQKFASKLPSLFGGAVSNLFATAVVWSKSAFYVISFILLWQSRLGKRMLNPLCAVGRMALTNYLAVYLISFIIFFGSSYYGNFRPSWGVILGIVIFILELLWSNLWFNFFKFGPMEWVWRFLTYGSLPTMRLKTNPKDK